MDHLERLIVDMKESLEREIRAVNDNLERKIEDGFKQVNTRFDTRRCDSPVPFVSAIAAPPFVCES